MKAVLFDFRNTVLRVDQAYERCAARLYEFVRERRANVSPEDFRDVWKAADGARFAAGQNITVHDWTRLILTDVLERLDLGLTAAERDRAIDDYERVFVVSVELYPGTTSLFEKLRARDLMLGLVIDGTKARENRILDRLELRRYMHTVVISEEVHFNKFTPVPLETAVKRLGCGPQYIVVVGDRIDKDIVNANKLGMVSVLLKPETSLVRNRKLDVTTPDFEIGTLEDVLRVVEDASARIR
jgi:putative hydrolase of the HAD superfamily